MKGLLIKDMMILFRQKTMLLIIFVIGIFMSMDGRDPSFALGYMMVISSMLVITTISYDYFENGMVFMFTLPVRRKTYVAEKYLFMFLVELAVGVAALLIQLVSGLIGQQADWNVFLGTGAACMISATLIMAVYIPIHLQFGPEKSRIAIFGLAGIIVLITYLGSKFRGVQALLEKLAENLVDTLERMGIAQVIGLGILTWVMLMAGSIGISMGIIEKKEF